MLPFKWDSRKSELLKKKRGLTFSEVLNVFETEVGGGQKNDDPVQHYIVGFSANGTMVTVIYEFRSDEQCDFIWLVIYWKTTKEEKKWLS